MKTAFDIALMIGNEKMDENILGIANFLRTGFLDKGYPGKSSGKGFYSYPGQAFAKPDFLS
jgi:3-hydroxybutyryl-CoA dehydrogenase